MSHLSAFFLLKLKSAWLQSLRATNQCNGKKSKESVTGLCFPSHALQIYKLHFPRTLPSYVRLICVTTSIGS